MKDQGITDTKLSENYDIKTPLECFKIDVEDLSVESRDDLKSDVAVGSEVVRFV